MHSEKPLKVALIGARSDILERAVVSFSAATPWHEFIAVADGYFDKTDSPKVLADLSAINPDITLVAMGSPSQEIWIDSNIGQGHGRVVFGVGALFDFVSGAVPRAPETIRNLRLEWVWRLFLEPSRLCAATFSVIRFSSSTSCATSFPVRAGRPGFQPDAAC